LLLTIQLGQGDQQQRVLRRTCTVFAEGFAAFAAWFAARNAQVDDFFLGKQRQTVGFGSEVTPVEAASSLHELTVFVPGCARRCADGIAGLVGLQRLVTGDQVDRRQAFAQVLFELFGPDAHTA